MPQGWIVHRFGRAEASRACAPEKGQPGNGGWLLTARQPRQAAEELRKAVPAEVPMKKLGFG